MNFTGAAIIVDLVDRVDRLEAAAPAWAAAREPVMHGDKENGKWIRTG